MKTAWGIPPITEIDTTDLWKLTDSQLEFLKNSGKELKIMYSTPARGSSVFYELWKINE